MVHTGATAEILELYGQLHSAFRDMLAGARAANWETVVALGKQTEALQSRLAELEGTTTLDQAAMQAKGTLVAQTLELVAAIRALAEPAQTEIVGLLADNTQRHRIAGAYGV